MGASPLADRSAAAKPARSQTVHARRQPVGVLRVCAARAVRAGAAGDGATRNAGDGRVKPLEFPPPPRRVLLIKPSAIGDVVHTLPILALLRRRWPGAH